MTQVRYPWEDAELLTAEEAAEELGSDAEYDEWLDELLADVDKAFDVDADPWYGLRLNLQQQGAFQDVPGSWGRGTMEDEPGYLESTAPYLF